MKCMMHFHQLTLHTADAACCETLNCINQVFRILNEKAEGGDYLVSRKHSSNKGLTPGHNNTRPAGEVPKDDELICPLNGTFLSLK